MGSGSVAQCRAVLLLREPPRSKEKSGLVHPKLRAAQGPFDSSSYRVGGSKPRRMTVITGCKRNSEYSFARMLCNRLGVRLAGWHRPSSVTRTLRSWAVLSRGQRGPEPRAHWGSATAAPVSGDTCGLSRRPAQGMLTDGRPGDRHLLCPWLLAAQHAPHEGTRLHDAGRSGKGGHERHPDGETPQIKNKRIICKT